MKKNMLPPARSGIHFKFGLKMKLSALFTLVCILCLQANTGFSQKSKVTLHLENVTVETVLDKIESETDFLFIYKTREVDLSRKVTLKVKQKKISEILKLLFQGTRTDYEISKNQIILTQHTNKVFLNPPVQQGPIRVTGTVTDASGNPLPGVAVVLKGTKNGVATDFDGNYTITVPGPQSVLVFTSIGFDSKEVTVGKQQILNVTLKEAVSELDEVVVSTGYWQEKRKLSTGNIGKIDAKVIERQPVLNPLEALQGQVAGVFIEQTSGLPGARININIRGINSLNNGFIPDTPNSNLPLIVIDGVPFL